MLTPHHNSGVILGILFNLFVSQIFFVKISYIQFFSLKGLLEFNSMRQCVLHFLLPLIIGWLSFFVLFFWVFAHSLCVPKFNKFVVLRSQALPRYF